jgi:hypothetical protein
VVTAIALYYPWMHFQDDQWVKLALLTWYNVARIRPPGVSNRDSELVRQITAETDFVIDKSPGREELQHVSATFGDLLIRLRHQGISADPAGVRAVRPAAYAVLRAHHESRLSGTEPSIQ